MKKRSLAAFCLAAMVLGLLLPAAAAEDDVCFLSLNDTLAPLTADLMPIRVSGVVYVPCDVFDKRMTGMDLGVYYGQDKTLGTVTLYSRESTLVFYLNGGYAYDSAGHYYAYRTITRNGRTYLPVLRVCLFFGLEYSSLSTNYGPLYRLKITGQYWLTDSVFISSATTLMNNRLNEYRQNQVQSPSSGLSPEPTVMPTQPSSGEHNNVRVYLAIQVESGTYLEEMLDTLSEQSVPALFFFRVSQLREYDDLIRRIAGTGGQIGLVAEGDTAEEMAKGIEEGNLLLERIALERTYTVLVSGDHLRTALEQMGYLCWLENVDGRPYGRGSARLSSDIIKKVDAKRSFARILMTDAGSSPVALRSVLRTLREEEYDIRLAVETTLS